jgi:cell division transport system permease protein
VQIGDMRSPDSAARVAAAVALLKATPGIADARVLGKADVDRLLEPWLGKETMAADLPVPALIDVRLKPGTDLDTAALAMRLAAAIPTAHLDDHKPWLAHMVRFARTLQSLAVCIALLVGLATVALVVFATRAGLAVHGDAIEVLHLIGARDSYIAGQFQRYTLRLALGGALLGLLLAGGVMVLLGSVAANLEAPLLPRMQLQPLHLAMLAMVPAAAVALATFTARRTVLGTLKRMI